MENKKPIDPEQLFDIKKICPFKSPSRSLDVPNWPMAQHRGTARFRVQTDPGGREYAIRQIDGMDCKRTTPSAWRVYIVTGANGRHYIIGYRPNTKECFIVAGSMRKPHFVKRGHPLYDAIFDVVFQMNNPNSTKY